MNPTNIIFKEMNSQTTPKFENVKRFDAALLQTFPDLAELQSCIEDLMDLFDTQQWNVSYTKEGYVGLGFFKKRRHLMSYNIRKGQLTNKSDEGTGQIREILRRYQDTLQAFARHVMDFAVKQN